MIVSLDDMKLYLKIEDDTYDTFLTQQLSFIQAAIENYCRRKFDATTYIQTFYKDDYEVSKEIALYSFPVNSITSIVEDTVTLAPTNYRLHKGTGYIIRPETGFFTSAKETVVTYEAGYSYANMPISLQHVVYSLVSERYSKEKSGVSLNFGSDVQRVSIPGTISIDFDYSLSNNDRSTPFGTVLGSQLNVLDYYRSERTIIGSGKLAYVA